jgi:hypothetical protein
MSGVFQNIDPPTNILEDARQSSVLYICKHFLIKQKRLIPSILKNIFILLFAEATSDRKIFPKK